MHIPVSIIIHHSASPRETTTVERIREWHTAKGWSDIGYHFVIEADGTVSRGRPIHLQGAHAPPNKGRLGICIVGDNTESGEEWTLQQLMGAQEQIWKLTDVFGPLMLAGHRDVMEPGHTECPGCDIGGLFRDLRG